MQPTVILGSGGHAKVIIEIMRASGVFEPVGCVGPDAPEEGQLLGCPYLGGDEQLEEIRFSGVQWAFVALGDNLIRDALMSQLAEQGFFLANAVSPMATVSPSARIGRGIAVMPGAVIGPDSVVEDGCIINTRSSVDHDGRLLTCCHVGPGATLAGNVEIGSHAFIATGSSIIPEIRIGDNSIVGAGSVVVRDIPSHVVAYGVPAEVQRTIGPASSTNSMRLRVEAEPSFSHQEQTTDATRDDDDPRSKFRLVS